MSIPGREEVARVKSYLQYPPQGLGECDVNFVWLGRA